MLFAQGLLSRISVRLVYHILYYYTVRVKITIRIMWVLRSRYYNDSLRVEAIRQLLTVSIVPSFSGGLKIQC